MPDLARRSFSSRAVAQYETSRFFLLDYTNIFCRARLCLLEDPLTLVCAAESIRMIQANVLIGWDAVFEYEGQTYVKRFSFDTVPC